MRGAVLILMTAAAVGGCSFRPITPPVPSSPSASMERGEAARSREDRMHPACRDNRADRDDQNRGCRDVARRGR